MNAHDTVSKPQRNSPAVNTVQVLCADRTKEKIDTLDVY